MNENYVTLMLLFMIALFAIGMFFLDHLVNILDERLQNVQSRLASIDVELRRIIERREVYVRSNDVVVHRDGNQVEVFRVSAEKAIELQDIKGG